MNQDLSGESNYDTSLSIKCLQYSPHGECFSGWGPHHKNMKYKNKCGFKALKFIDDLLQPQNDDDESVDFASIIYVPKDVVDVNEFRGKWGMIDQHCPARYEDSATLIYNKNNWKPLPGPDVGVCAPDRSASKPYAIVMQGFEPLHGKTGRNVVVMAAHLPHDKYHHHLDEVRKDLKEYMRQHDGRNTRFILLTDSNEPKERSLGKDILEMLGVKMLERKTISAHTDGFLSCCYPKFWVRGYDRIIANFGFMEETVQNLLSEEEINNWPGDRHNMHLPVIGYLRSRW